MKIAVASGKGGTGKTTIATSFAISMASFPISKDRPGYANSKHQPFFDNHSVLYIDCDVEAPNAHLFFLPELDESNIVSIQIPEIDKKLCTYCGRCASVCQYHAITVIGKNVMVFPQLCHGCGSCMLNCPENAIKEIPSPIGYVEKGTTGKGILFSHGILNIGEPMAVPVIRQLKNWMFKNNNQLIILDSPPGNSCPMVETIRGVDFVILVTEPTPFGFHDLKLAVEVIKTLGIPLGIILNRDNIAKSADMEHFMKENKIPLLMHIPFERKIAEATAQGLTLLEIYPDYRNKFHDLYIEIQGIIHDYAK